MDPDSPSAPRVNVVLHNDSITPFDFVASLLEDVFGFSRFEAAGLALRAHRDGSAIISTSLSETCTPLVAAAEERIAASPYPLKLSLKPVAAPGATGLLTSVPIVPVREQVAPDGVVVSIARCMRNAVRALFFRRGDWQPAASHGAAVVGIAALAIFAEIVTGWVANGRMSLPSAWGISSSAACLGLLACALLLLSGRRKAFDVANAFSLLVCVAVLLAPLTVFVAELLQRAPPISGGDVVQYVSTGVSCALFAWWLSAVATLGARLMPARRLRGAIGFPAAAMLSSFLLPNEPPVPSISNYTNSSGLLDLAFDLVRSPPEPGQDAPTPVDAEGTYARQPRLIAAELEHVLPSRKDRTEIYFVSVGAYAEQDIFLRESTSAREIFDARMGTRGRSLLLVNNRQTLEKIPLASATNLEQVIGRLAGLMDTEKDVLVLFLTSHGSQEALSVSFDGFSFNDLTPVRLKEMLDNSSIRHRVVIVSACHSGAFIPVLEGKNTLVMTAARADRSSFGCSNERDWTYFGDAYFNRALRQTRSLVEAFGIASTQIAAWEKRDGLTPSEPQLAAGEDVSAMLQKVAAELEANDPNEKSTASSKNQARAADIR